MIKDNYIIQYNTIQYEMASVWNMALCAEGREAMQANNCMLGLQEAM